MTDYSDFLSQREVDSPVQPIDQLRDGVPSTDNQASKSFTLTVFQQTIPEGFSTFGSMNIEDYLDSLLTAGESQSPAQIHVDNSHMAISTVAAMEPDTAATMTADTVAIAAVPQFNIAAASLNPTNSVEQQVLRQQGSSTLPAHSGQRQVEEVWLGIRQSQLQQDDNVPTNVERAGPVQRQTTTGEMTLEEFLVNMGVLSPVRQPPEEYQNINYRGVELGPPGYMGRPVMSLGEGGGNSINVPTYPATLPRSSSGDATFLPSAYQPPAVCYGGSSDGLEVDGVNWFGMQTGGAQNQIVSGPVQEVVQRRSRRMLKNRASAARSRARKQAYPLVLKAEIDQITEENNIIRQTLAALEKKIEQQQVEQEKLKHRVSMLKRSKSWP